MKKEKEKEKEKNENNELENEMSEKEDHNTADESPTKETENKENEAENNEKQENKKMQSYETLLRERNELNEKYLRLAADFQNYKRRMENEKKEIFSYANETIITELLSVLDNFERAMDSDKSSEKTLMEGVQMIYNELRDILFKYGLKEINTENSEFDPNFHHAVMKESVDYTVSNMIIEVFQKGYTFNGKVIRPSMVKVSE